MLQFGIIWNYRFSIEQNNNLIIYFDDSNLYLLGLAKDTTLNAMEMALFVLWWYTYMDIFIWFTYLPFARFGWIQ